MSDIGTNTDPVPGDVMTESRFHMWRAIFALAHADEKVTLEERQFLEDVLRREPFNDEQKVLLKADIKNPQDIGRMFKGITDQIDRSAFFYFARLLCWCDGDFAKQEQQIILKLKETHLKEMNFETMIGTVEMELADEEKQWLEEDIQIVKSDAEGEGNIHSFMNAFVNRFNSRKKRG